MTTPIGTRFSVAMMSLLAVGSFGLVHPLPASAETCSPSDIALYTQAEVNAFPPGCTEIAGDLTVGPSSDITNLSALSSLTTVGEDLDIEDNDALVHVDGLSSLTSVRKDINIEDNLFLANVDGLAALTSVGEDVDIEDNLSLTNIDGLASVTAVGGDLDIEDNRFLSRCSCGLVALFAGGGPSGDISMRGNRGGGDCNNDGADIAAESCP